MYRLWSKNGLISQVIIIIVMVSFLWSYRTVYAGEYTWRAAIICGGTTTPYPHARGDARLDWTNQAFNAWGEVDSRLFKWYGSYWAVVAESGARYSGSSWTIGLTDTSHALPGTFTETAEAYASFFTGVKRQATGTVYCRQ